MNPHCLYWASYSFGDQFDFFFQDIPSVILDMFSLFHSSFSIHQIPVCSYAVINSCSSLPDINEMISARFTLKSGFLITAATARFAVSQAYMVSELIFKPLSYR